MNQASRVAIALRCIAIACLLCLAAAARAEPVLRIISYQVAPEDHEKWTQVIDNEVKTALAGVKGLLWVREYYDKASGEHGSVSLWESQGDLDAFLKSDVRKPIIEKMTPLQKTKPAAKVYSTLNPKP